jgi:excisionase family DNA binding protein
VAQAAVVLQVSEDTIARLVRRGVLARVPHLDGKVLIPRASVAELLSDGSAPRAATTAAEKNLSRLRSATGP